MTDRAAPPARRVSPDADGPAPRFAIDFRQRAVLATRGCAWPTRCSPGQACWRNQGHGRPPGLGGVRGHLRAADLRVRAETRAPGRRRRRPYAGGPRGRGPLGGPAGLRPGPRDVPGLAVPGGPQRAGRLRGGPPAPAAGQRRHRPPAAGWRRSRPRRRTRRRPGSGSTSGNCSPWRREQVRRDFQESTWQAFWRTAILGKSGKEVAGVLGLTTAAVYLAKRRVTERLRQQIEYLRAE